MLFLFCFAGLIIHAQDCPVDSIFSAYNTSVFASANDKGVCYIELGRELAINASLECGIEALDRALPLLSDSVQILRAICIKGLVLGNLGKYDEARKLFMSVVPFCERQRPFLDSTYLNWIIEGVYDGLAKSCTFTGDYGLAIRSAYTSLELGLLFPRKADICGKYADLGMLYYKLRDNATAARMYKKALSLEKGLGEGYSAILSDLALCYSEMDSVDQAIIYLDSAAVVCHDSLPKQGVFWNFTHGLIDLKRGAPGEAGGYFKRSLLASEERDYPRMVADNLVYLARVYLSIRNYDSAGYVLLNGEEIAKANNFKEILLDIYRQSILLSEETGNYHKLANYQQHYIDHKASIYTGELTRDLAIVEGQMAEQDHLERLHIQQREIATREALLESHKWAQRLGITVALLVLFLTVLQFQVIAQRRKIKEALSIRIKERASRFNDNKKAIALWSDKLNTVNVLVSHELDVIYLFLNATSARGNEHGSEQRLIDLAFRKFEQDSMVTRLTKGQRTLFIRTEV